MADSTKKKNYAKGSAKAVTFQNGGEIINIDLKIEGGKILGSTGPISPNEAGYIRLRVTRLSQVDQYGNTHAVYENDYKPEPGKKGEAAKPTSITPSKAKVKVSTSTDDMPF